LQVLLIHLRNKGFNGTVTYPSSDECGIDTSQTNPAELNISMISFSVICKWHAHNWLICARERKKERPGTVTT
jgi:hypothetical protein